MPMSHYKPNRVREQYERQEQRAIIIPSPRAPKQRKAETSQPSDNSSS